MTSERKRKSNVVTNLGMNPNPKKSGDNRVIYKVKSRSSSSVLCKSPVKLTRNQCLFPTASDGISDTRNRDTSLYSKRVKTQDHQDPISTKIIARPTLESTGMGPLITGLSQLMIPLKSVSHIIESSDMIVDLGVRIQKPFTMHPYQISAVKWMRSKVDGGLISLEMGLGKTIISLVHMVSQPGPRLVVVPSALIESWLRDARKFLGHSVVFNVIPGVKRRSSKNRQSSRTKSQGYSTQDIQYHTSNDLTLCTKTRGVNVSSSGANEASVSPLTVDSDIEFEPNKQSSTHACVIAIVTYDTLARAEPEDQILTTKWNLVCADESHRFVNHKTKLFQKLLLLNATHKFCLSGTPMCNFNQDILNQIKFIRTRPDGEHPTDLKEEDMMEYIYALTYEAVGITLPLKEIINIKILLGETESNLCLAVMASPLLQIVKLQLLRQICVIPNLVSKLPSLIQHLDPAMVAWLQSANGDAGMQCHKLRRLNELATEVCVQNNRQLLVFCTFARALQWAQRCLPPNVSSGIISAQVAQDSRQRLIDKFTSGYIRVLFLTYKIGACGLNLQNCSDVVFMNPWWSHISQKQAETRVYRMGQEKSVKVYSLVCEGTIEEEVLSVSDGKDVQMNKLLKSAVAKSVK